MEESDWRLETAGHESFRGLTFRVERWRQREGRMWDPRTGEPTTTVWDHDHCHFCWAKFAEPHEDDPDRLQTGYVADDPRPDSQMTALDVAERFGGQVRVQEPVGDPGIWVCPRCFEDLAPYYGWTIEGEQSR